MTLVRQIALLFAMVIATIAVSLTPSSAQAHDGHAHAAVSVAGHAAHAMPSGLEVEATPMIQAVVAADCACPSCASGGHHGSCCFSGGLAPAGLTTSLPPTASARAAACDYANLAGIVPEALPEPPRPFA